MGALAIELERGHDPRGTHRRAAPGLRDLVRERLTLSHEASLQAIAQQMVNGLTGEMLQEAAFKGLLEILGEEERNRRRPARRGESIPRHSASELRAAAQMFDRYSLRYPTEHGPKLLGDFTRPDAEWTMKRYQASAAADIKEADRFREIAKRATGGRTVREAISHDALEEIFNA